MRRITVRLPDDTVQAFDEAPANRSKLIRNLLVDHVAEGGLDVPDRLQKLANADRAKERNRWDVKDSGLRGRAYRFVKQRWQEGTHPPDALDRALGGFRDEASASEDEGAVEYIENVASWYSANWPEHDPSRRPEFPDAAAFHDSGDRDDDGVDEAIVARASSLLDDTERSVVVERIARDYDIETASAAVRRAAE